MGLALWPINFLLLRRTDLLHSTVVVCACTFGAILVVMPLAGVFGVVAGVGAALLSMAYCFLQAREAREAASPESSPATGAPAHRPPHIGGSPRSG